MAIRFAPDVSEPTASSAAKFELRRRLELSIRLRNRSTFSAIIATSGASVFAMNIVFWTTLLALACAGGVQWWIARWRRAADDQIADEALSFARHKRWPLAPDRWSLESIDLLASAERIRAVVSLELREDDPGRRRRAIELVAHEVYRHTEVQAVFVEALHAGPTPDLYLFAADGRGWWGREIISTALAGPEFTSRQNR